MVVGAMGSSIFTDKVAMNYLAKELGGSRSVEAAGAWGSESMGQQECRAAEASGRRSEGQRERGGSMSVGKV